jgi:aspartokinase-like uncharacterized kinase
MPPTVVYKIGGSLLDLPDLAERLGRLLALRPGTRSLLVTGGGAAADVVREYDRIHRLGDDASHWLAIESLGLNERLVVQLLPGAVHVGDRSEAEQAWARGRIPVLSAATFLRHEEQAHASAGVNRQPSVADPLPHTWSVTSDSIAAWIALRWLADELVLVKSTGARSGLVGTSRDEPLVDDHFPRLAAVLPRLGWVNLRDANPEIAAVSVEP